MTRFTFLLALLVVAAPALAEEGGALTGQLGAAPVTLSVWPGQSDFWGDASYGGVSIMARNEAGVFSLGFETSGSNASLPEITWRPKDDAGGYFADEDTGAQVSLSTVELIAGELHLVGSATADLAYSVDFGRTLDAANAIPTSVAFDVTLAPLD